MYDTVVSHNRPMRPCNYSFELNLHVYPAKLDDSTAHGCSTRVVFYSVCRTFIANGVLPSQTGALTIKASGQRENTVPVHWERTISVFLEPKVYFDCSLTHRGNQDCAALSQASSYCSEFMSRVSVAGRHPIDGKHAVTLVLQLCSFATFMSQVTSLFSTVVTIPLIPH